MVAKGSSVGSVEQDLFLTNNVTFIAINGLVGVHLAPLG